MVNERYTGSVSAVLQSLTRILTELYQLVGDVSLGQEGAHHRLHFDDLLHLGLVQSEDNKTNVWSQASTGPQYTLCHHSPRQKLDIVVAQEHLRLADQPALHFQPDQQQATVLLGHVHRFVKVERQKFVPERTQATKHAKPRHNTQ